MLLYIYILKTAIFVCCQCLNVTMCYTYLDLHNHCEIKVTWLCNIHKSMYICVYELHLSLFQFIFRSDNFQEYYRSNLEVFQQHWIAHCVIICCHYTLKK